MRPANATWAKMLMLLAVLLLPGAALSQDMPGDESSQPTPVPVESPVAPAVTRATQPGGITNFCDTNELTVSRTLALQSEEIAWRATGLVPGSRVSPRAVDMLAATGASVTQLATAVVGNQCDVSGSFLASDLSLATYTLTVTGATSRGGNVEMSATFSIVASSRPPAPTATPRPIPAAPGGLRASTVGPNTIRLDWADNSNNETGFRIDSDAGQFRTGANVTTYNVGGLTHSTPYCFSLYAFNDAGEAFGGTSCAFTQAPR